MNKFNGAFKKVGFFIEFSKICMLYAKIRLKNCTPGNVRVNFEYFNPWLQIHVELYKILVYIF